MRPCDSRPCLGRQSRRCLETASLFPPLAAFRLFPLDLPHPRVETNCASFAFPCRESEPRSVCFSFPHKSCAFVGIPDAVTGDAAPGGWGEEFSAGACPAENDSIFLIRRADQPEKTNGFFPGPFSWVPAGTGNWEKSYLNLDILSEFKYNTRCVPKTAGEGNLVSPAEGGKCSLLSVLVPLRTSGRFLFERTDESYGGETKHA